MPCQILLTSGDVCEAPSAVVVSAQVRDGSKRIFICARHAAQMVIPCFSSGCPIAPKKEAP